MAGKKKSEKRIKKENYWFRLQKAAGEYKNVLFIDGDNVSSLQVLKIRARLREINALMIMGKNTLMKAALTAANKEPEEGDDDYEERKKTWQHNPTIDKIISQLKGNTNLILSNGDLGEVKQVLDEEVRPSPAKTGMVAPDDVSIFPGATGLDPKQTSFFQTLQIQTKIVKAQIDIVAEKKVITKGERITSTQAALLDKLKIYPFSYKMEVKKVLQDGSMFDPAVLDLSLETIRAKFQSAIKIQTSLSLGLGYSTAASAPHTLLGGFKNLIAVAAETGYEFPEATAFLDAAKNAPAAGPAAASTGAAKADAPKAEEKPEEEEADVDMGGLFGDEEDY